MIGKITAIVLTLLFPLSLAATVHDQTRDSTDYSTISELNDLTGTIDAASAFIVNHPEIEFPDRCCDTPGDATDDGVCNSGDVVRIIAFVFKGAAPPICLTEADANGDGVINMGDAIRIIDYIFRGGPPPICGPE